MKKVLCALVMVLVIASSSCAAKVDLDLTKFSTVMVYSGLFDVMANPDAYIGKVIKLKGQFQAYHDEETGNYYFGVMVSDAAACCATGIDFVLKPSYKFPQDYPQIEDTITVAGKFEIYQEGQETFCRLGDAELM